MLFQFFLFTKFHPDLQMILRRLQQSEGIVTDLDTLRCLECFTDFFQDMIEQISSRLSRNLNNSSGGIFTVDSSGGHENGKRSDVGTYINSISTNPQYQW